MAEPRTLESIVDPFVQRAGGQRISEIIGNKNPAKIADCLFQTLNVIAELKSLQAGTFVESIQRKMSELFTRWQQETIRELTRQILESARASVGQSVSPP